MSRVRTRLRTAILVAFAVAPAACSSVLKDELPEASPALADMEEPLALREEPKDETTRRAMPPGSFTGLTVAEAKRSLEQLALGGTVGGTVGGTGVRVTRVVENSPADAAGIEEDDLLVAAAVPSGTKDLRWPSEWRKLELDLAPGTQIAVTIDRAAEEREVRLTTVARVRPAERMNAERFREEKRIGVVLRTATEVEARGAALGPGAGAVIVGLAAG
ncbi:MAG: S1C family serine protease, partial [Planctomycetes bacterium]|nr:S1C family serine protease [Planctomycetota bacterium]